MFRLPGLFQEAHCCTRFVSKLVVMSQSHMTQGSQEQSQWHRLCTKGFLKGGDGIRDGRNKKLCWKHANLNVDTSYYYFCMSTRHKDIFKYGFPSVNFMHYKVNNDSITKRLPLQDVSESQLCTWIGHD